MSCYTISNELIDQGMWGHFTHETESPWSFHFKALSLVGKAEPVQVRFTQHLRDQRSMRMQDGCNVYMDFYVALTGSCFMTAWIIFKTTSWR